MQTKVVQRSNISCVVDGNDVI